MTDFRALPTSLTRRSLLATALASGAFAGLGGMARAEDLDPESQALNTLLTGRNTPPIHQQSVASVRKAFEDYSGLFERPSVGIADVRDTTTPPTKENPVPVRIYTPQVPPSAGKPPILIYVHGGYFVAGDLDTHDHVARRLCQVCEALVVSVDYRRAPENRFPDPVSDCREVMRWVARSGDILGGDPERIGMCGDDAGGTLAASALITDRLTLPDGLKFLGLMTPIMMLTDSIPFESRQTYGTGQYRPSLRDLEWMERQYKGRDEVEPALYSPVEANSLRGLPETLMISAGYDSTRDAAGFFVRRLREAAVAANERRFSSTIHDFMYFVDVVPSARGAYDVVGEQFRRATAV